MTEQEQNTVIQYAVTIESVLSEALNDENHPNHIEIKEATINEFFHALANVVPTAYFNKIVGGDKNYLEFNHVANTLCVQYLNHKDDEEPGS